jgi:hypothetical protein
MNHRVHFVNQFMDILDPSNAFKKDTEISDLENAQTVKAISQHKAISKGDITLY